MIQRRNRWYQVITAACCIVLAGHGLGAEAAANPGAFPLKDGDTWVMVGDSITEQHLHSNYIEAFCYARFPKLNFHIRNAGLSGETIHRLLATGRFNTQAAPWKPTLVSVELGMNDAWTNHNISTSAYITNMTKLTECIRGIGARPMFFSPSAVNDFTCSTNRSAHNQRLEAYSTALRAFAAEQKAPFADQYHPLVDVWASKKLSGSSVHIAPGGQLTMAAAILEGLNAPGLVSKATLDISGKTGELIQCRITDVAIEKNGGISFDRIDECLPMPIPDEARGGLAVYPQIADLSQWILAVTGLKDGEYQIDIDGIPVARVTADILAKGWNMGTLEEGPVADQCRYILQLIEIKECWVSQWVRATKTPGKKMPVILAELNLKVLEADAMIREAAKPKSHHFSISPIQ